MLQIHFKFAFFSFFLTLLQLKREIRSCTSVVPSKTIPAISDQNSAKTLPDGATHTYIAYIREYPPGKKLKWWPIPKNKRKKLQQKQTRRSGEDNGLLNV